MRRRLRCAPYTPWCGALGCSRRGLKVSPAGQRKVSLDRIVNKGAFGKDPLRMMMILTFGCVTKVRADPALLARDEVVLRPVLVIAHHLLRFCFPCWFRAAQ